MDILVLDSQPIVSDINVHVKKWSDSELNSIWEKLFVPKYFNKIDCDDTDVQGILMLLQTAAENVKKLGSRYGDLLVCYNTSVKKLEEAEEEHIRLKTSLKSLKISPCDKCQSLKIELKGAKQRAEDAETRMNSIAKILRLGDDGGKSNDVKQSNKNDYLSSDCSVNTLSKLNKASTTKRKRCSSPYDKVVHVVESEDSESVKIVDNKEVLVSATIESIPKGPLSQSPTNLELEEGEQVPETPVTPLNDKFKNSGKGHENIEKCDESKKIKCLSNSVNIPPNSKNKSVNPAKRNLSADFIGNTVPSKSPEKKDILDSGISKNAVGNVVSSVTDMSSDSLAGFLKTSDTELDKIWFDGNLEDFVEDEDKGLGNKTIKKKRSVKGGNKNDTKSVWKLKQNKGPDKSVGLKRFKQTTLGVADKASKKDISQMKGFKGGKFESLSCNIISDDDDDIVMPSPKPKKNRRRHEADKFDTINLSLFAPVATSTQLPMKGNDTSYDRIPDKETSTNSPNYKYKREAVRGKEARAKLEGRECEDCIKYYKATGQNLSPDKLKERINACSRHKQQELRCKTPPGFWDPLMPSTEECRDRGMYTSIYCLKNSSK